MPKPQIKLLRYCLLKKDSHHAKFQFRLETVSSLKDHCISRLFHFSGHRWKVQVSKKNGCLGMFLRWYGTSDTDQLEHEETSSSSNTQCTVCPVFALLNVFIPTQSIIEGSRFDQETFTKFKDGIGYGSMVTTEHLQSNAGYIISNNLYLQMELKIVSTVFRDHLSYIHDNISGEGYVKGRSINFYGTLWSLVFYPNGEKDSVRLLEEEKDNNEYSSIYLVREGRMAMRRLRHNVQYRISVTGRNDILLDKHFYFKESNAYGTCRFIPINTVNEINELDISVTFEHVVPYSYFAYNKKDVLVRNSEESTPYFFEDHFSTQWSFTLHPEDYNNSQKHIRGYLTLVPDKRIKKLFKRQKDVQVCWFVEILSPKDIEMSVSMLTRSKRLVHDSVFNQQSTVDSVEFPITVDQVSFPYCNLFIIEFLKGLFVSDTFSQGINNNVSPFICPFVAYPSIYLYR